MAHIWQEKERSWRRLYLRGRLVMTCAAKAGKATIAHETTIVAAAIGYFTLFSLFPLMLISVAIGSLWLDPIMAESEIVTQLEFIAPALGDLLGANIEQIVLARGPITGLAFMILLWSSSNIFNVFTHAMDRIWQVDEARSGWRHRGLAILLAMSVSILLLIASFIEGAIFTFFSAFLPEPLLRVQPFLSQWGAIAMNITLFALLYYFLPHINLTWRIVLPGALIAGFVWEVAKQTFLWVIANYLSRTNLVYGSLATIMVFLTWTYASSFIFLFGTYFNFAYAQARKRAVSSNAAKGIRPAAILGNPIDV